MKYIDGFVIPVPKKNLDAYKAMSEEGGQGLEGAWRAQYRECVGEDLEHEGMASFTKLAKAKADEAVVFSWIVFKSRAHRDRVNKKCMTDARLLAMCKPEDSLFNVKRMAYGGFGVMVDL